MWNLRVAPCCFQNTKLDAILSLILKNKCVCLTFEQGSRTLVVGKRPAPAFSHIFWNVRCSSGNSLFFMMCIRSFRSQTH